MLHETHHWVAPAQGLPEAGSSLLCGFHTQCRVVANTAQLPSQLQTGRLIKHSLNDAAECCWPNVPAQPSGRPAFPDPGADQALREAMSKGSREGRAGQDGDRSQQAKRRGKY